MSPFPAWVLLLSLCYLFVQRGYAQISLYGSGTSTASHDVDNIMSTLMSQSRPDVVMAYRDIGTGPGLSEFVASQGIYNSSAFVVSGLPVDSSSYVSGQMLQAPLAILKVSVWHSLPASTYSGNVNLTSCLLARIFSKAITAWDHADIIALNPNLKVPSNYPITLIGRTDLSPSVMSFTNYIEWACAPSASPWTGGSQRQAPASSWAPGTVLVTDTDTLIKKLWSADPTYVPGAISFSDYAWGARYNQDYMANINEVALQLGNGTFATAATAVSTVVAGMLTTTPTSTYPAITANWAANPYQFLNTTAANGWPMTMPIMIIMRPDLRNFGAQGRLLGAFLNYTLSDAGQAIISSNFHVPLPSDVRADLVSQLNANLLFDPTTTPWTFELEDSPLAVVGGADYVFSAHRTNYVTQEVELIDRLLMTVTNLQAEITALQVQATFAAADRAAAAEDRARINATVASIAATEATAQAATQIAIAGVVLAVVLAVVALIVAIVYIVRTKKLDQKYSKYLPLGVKARFDDNPENL